MKPRPSFPAKLPPAGGQPALALNPLAVQVNPRPVAVGQEPRIGRVSPASGRSSPLLSVPVSSGLGLDSGAVRARMVAKLAEQGVQDPWVLQAMGQVERHRFVETALAGQAYEDTSLPIGLGQTISKPNVVARMIELLRQDAPGKLGRVLEIGTGCGYQSAVLSHLASEVYSIERLRGLHEKAKKNLLPFRLPNVHLMLGDGMLGFPKGAPYAGIISAAGGDEVPVVWLEQLAVGARLVAPTVTASGHQALVVIRRTATGYDRQVLEAVHFVPLKSGIA
ncbi:protein-L-isoaspartate(D-aspartate) O-methyltransferase [Limnohabitans sp. 2KL-51]|uniref:protein-L-isoaspartate(D-aspartate) O-methyltransferase n=1 Tax=Limnohabitans sp. 2KL-51 TaxID=1977911 RepID=UPI000DD238DB|nr:protein-L-isoaspartate(D-aspartate) O-methyltransferase [Limnohabitans sp. 2KL-51]PUE46593.1 protein-L-isoaspartate O-methyltransferase [Limnohabitans sp. 2KL-51]